MTRTPPRHGERRCYLRGCHRPECVDANKRYCKQYRVATVHRPIRLDATPVRRRIEQWAEQGYSQTQIVAVTGGHTAEITKIIAGQPTVAPAVARRILNSPGPTGTPFHAVTDSTGTIRRAQALHAIGHSYYKIAASVPMAVNHLGRLLDQQPATVRLSVAEGMTAAYKRLSGIPGTDTRAKARAASRNWKSVAAWDDNIDDPNAQADETDPYESAGKYERDPDRKREIEHLYLLGESVQSIAKQLRGSEKYIENRLGAILRERAARAEQERSSAATPRSQQALAA